MEKKFVINEDYIGIPVQAGKPEQTLEVFIEDKGNRSKFTELKIPVSEEAAEYDYLAYINVKALQDQAVILSGNMPQHFWKQVILTSSKEVREEEHPVIHFAADAGWINDPNGLVFADGIYHLYFQYNPFNISWENMSWGHAVSRDLLHWEQKDTVLYPDKNGTMFSGSGIVNEKGALGLPETALLFFYTTAGSTSKWSEGEAFTQRMAYSLDGGESLVKMDAPYLEAVSKENRDPKVFWHEESKAYIMTLWLEKNDFAILRSEDLKEWLISERFTLEEAWECPDLIKVPGENGEEQWMFWSADGFYYWGEFDGYHFMTDKVQHRAYINKLPYAAQTYSGITDRVVSVSWLRTHNQGRLFTGAMGIPRELTMREIEGKRYLVQQPVREILEQRKLCWSKQNESQETFKYESQEKKAVQIETILNAGHTQAAKWQFNGTTVSYEPVTGRLCIGEETYLTEKNQCDFNFILDDIVLEVGINQGTVIGVFEIKRNPLNITGDIKGAKSFKLYELI